jgi:hypothetical protein
MTQPISQEWAQKRETGYQAIRKEVLGLMDAAEAYVHNALCANRSKSEDLAALDALLEICQLEMQPQTTSMKPVPQRAYVTTVNPLYARAA